MLNLYEEARLAAQFACEIADLYGKMNAAEDNKSKKAALNALTDKLSEWVASGNLAISPNSQTRTAPGGKQFYTDLLAYTAGKNTEKMSDDPLTDEELDVLGDEGAAKFRFLLWGKSDPENPQKIPPASKGNKICRSLLEYCILMRDFETAAACYGCVSGKKNPTAKDYIEAVNARLKKFDQAYTYDVFDAAISYFERHARHFHEGKAQMRHLLSMRDGLTEYRIPLSLMSEANTPRIMIAMTLIYYWCKDMIPKDVNGRTELFPVPIINHTTLGMWMNEKNQEACFREEFKSYTGRDLKVVSVSMGSGESPFTLAALSQHAVEEFRKAEKTDDQVLIVNEKKPREALNALMALKENKTSSP